MKLAYVLSQEQQPADHKLGQTHQPGKHSQKVLPATTSEAAVGRIEGYRTSNEKHSIDLGVSQRNVQSKPSHAYYHEICISTKY
jgi:hypothetical protein